ncbi:NAD(P)H-binding protein [Pengzhenrongella frigida]|uniref:NAD-dependent epimerase/dehydratase family protein n=1 Tax=Pengzhenrongella frigida TaxID=1259133 RepID=A0A4Q5MVT0_9MICO|nr:NAD(P)H-binding protein [Cellulomonas sp. HLT2-17]RYV49625.1 NAD-dependent epimerase/dehydratase family protein [Cellulomonas sp. HLT2-17]
MTTIAVLGASGQIGRSLVALLAARGDTVLGIVRSPERVVEIDALGGRGVLLDVEHATAAQLAAALGGADAVVFAAGAGAGSGAERKRTVDLGGSVLLARAAALAGIARYVQISAAGIDQPAAADADPSWAAYVEAKREADERLRATALDWTILRPGPLTDVRGTGLVALTAVADGGPVPRADVAALVVACLDEPASIGAQWWVAGGGEPVARAVHRAARLLAEAS